MYMQVMLSTNLVNTHDVIFSFLLILEFWVSINVMGGPLPRQRLLFVSSENKPCIRGLMARLIIF